MHAALRALAELAAGDGWLPRRVHTDLFPRLWQTHLSNHAPGLQYQPESSLAPVRQQRKTPPLDQSGSLDVARAWNRALNEALSNQSDITL